MDHINFVTVVSYCSTEVGFGELPSANLPRLGHIFFVKQSKRRRKISNPARAFPDCATLLKSFPSARGHNNEQLDGFETQMGRASAIQTYIFDSHFSSAIVSSSLSGAKCLNLSHRPPLGAKPCAEVRLVRRCAALKSLIPRTDAACSEHYGRATPALQQSKA